MTVTFGLCQYVCGIGPVQSSAGDQESSNRCMTPPSKLPFIYVSSAPFSGSTLFSLLAGTHPHICTVGEMTGPIQRQDPGRYKCSCGKLIRNCEFWADVTSRMASEGMAFDPGSFGTRIRVGHPHIGERLL